MWGDARFSNVVFRDFNYYLVFAGLRFTVIMVRMGKLLADIGLVPPSFAYDNHIGHGLERQLARV